MKTQERPLITFALFAYNQERFIREALESAFLQTYSPLEIVLSDDCSEDNTFKIIQEMAEAYQGPHIIILNRNEKNLGIGAHINRVMKLANGVIIVAAAGDDISMPNRVARIQEEYELSKGMAKSIFSNVIDMDDAGQRLSEIFQSPIDSKMFHSKELVSKKSILTGCSHAWLREVFDVFGPLAVPLTCEDMVIPFRSSLLGEIRYIHDILVMHRLHQNNVWNHKSRDNADREIKQEHFWMNEQKAIFVNWIKDIQKMKELAPDRMKEWKYLEDSTKERLLSVEKDISLHSTGLIKRLVIIIVSVLKEKNFGKFRHRIGYFIIPKIYRRYLSVKYRIMKRAKKDESPKSYEKFSNWR
jgi:glycosyltransferase involved in cell wall biosynthesis